MAWTPPRTWSVGDPLTALLMNQQLRDNLQHLKTPPLTRLGFVSFNTSSTSYVAVHETQNIITQAGGRVLLGAIGTAYQTASTALNIFITLYVDGEKIVTANDEGFVRAYISGTANIHVPWCILYATDTLAAAFHTFRLYAKVSGGTGSINLQHFMLLEI